MKKNLVACIVIVVSAAPSVVQAQAEDAAVEGATYTETIDWLVAQLPSFGTLRYRVSTETRGLGPVSYWVEQKTRARSGSCELAITSEMLGEGSSHASVTTVTVPFAAMDQISLRATSWTDWTEQGGMSASTTSPAIWTVIGETTGAKKLIRYEDSGPASLFAVTVSNREQARRVVKALKRAVELCGGKVDPF
jgi:hypothetical protein